ncbi:2-oxoglutarate dehydrogenase complex dihydrolipoyllysine-residue succinyltransferase [Indioceanicola profundi]|uniref:2-oxoglutarate dehydrogenase complex dihydrolipoyllysine-residue succinyltransferase n=1 Tax=Indioceanicola profundi TaxID=2220096 RepID=UPI000E6AC53E|nr:2-oxoglutarate dehydrogenase complex dihydrolipoyllysine-residue succinyltransferase [Indioceanicola profundi]
MATEIKVPTLGESVTEATVARWMKKVGEAVQADEPLLELETDKVTLEVNSPAAGTLAEITAEEGSNVGVDAVLGLISEGAAAPAPKPAAPAPQPAAAPAPQPAPAAAAPTPGAGVMPAARKMAADAGVDAGSIAGTGKDGRVTKGDVIQHLETPRRAAAPVPAARPAQPSGPRPRADQEERVRMTRLRQRIAERLKEAQNTAAMLTTFNEVDMTNVMALRNGLKDQFEKKHGVKLGFMSFFVKACITALKELPAVNAEIDGTDLVYKNYYDIGVAVGTPQGLVVPVVRDADKLSFAGVEQTIGNLGKKARDGKLSMEELSGGTFTISNGGVYGSLMSTPILNPPQSGILGMHKTMERPVAINGKVEIRPMMYLALSYDHRIIDGREAVTFLVRVKECIENPERMLLEV